MRPIDFLVNYNHPLREGLYFAILGQSPGSNIFVNNGILAGNATGVNITNYADAWQYSPIINRFTYKVTRASSHYINGPTYVGTPTQMSISIWLKSNSVAVNFPTPFGNGDANTDRNGFNFYFYSSEPIAETCGTSSFTYYRTSSGKAVANVWQHYAITYNNGYFYMYLNGQLLPQTAGATQGTFINPVMGTYPWRLGGDGTLTASYFYDGYISDPIAWIGRTLSIVEIQKLADPTNYMLNGLITYPKRKFYTTGYQKNILIFRQNNKALVLRTI